MNPDVEKWNKRYASDDLEYWSVPNQFFKNYISTIPSGKLLLPGEGGGRNAVYAAKLGWEVTAIDQSDKGKILAEKLCAKENVTINYHVRDLLDYTFPENYFDAFALIFVHFYEKDREQLLDKLYNSLTTGGIAIIEVFDHDQLTFPTGGPRTPDLLYSLEDIYTPFNKMDLIHFSKEVIDKSDRKHRVGKTSVIRFVGKK